MAKEKELEIFRKVCGSKKIVTSDHQNFSNGNKKKDGILNQQISIAKFREFIDKGEVDFSEWKSL